MKFQTRHRERKVWESCLFKVTKGISWYDALQLDYQELGIVDMNRKIFTTTETLR